ncbi:MAG TPA: heavy metal-associated domain-containing protein [Phycisphaerales bacterium]|nr:heavy metal-associated domain-containing protein [Phycisphaerales bacterium]
MLIGMRGNSCREKIMEALRGVPGVKDVNVSLIRARAVVICEPTCGAVELIEAVKDAGYDTTVDGS